MWRVTLDRHHKYAWHQQWVFETRFWILAYAVWMVWWVGYIMSNFYVRQLTLYRVKDGVLYLKGAKKLCTDEPTMKRLQWARKNSKSRRFWDYS